MKRKPMSLGAQLTILCLLFMLAQTFIVTFTMQMERGHVAAVD